MRLRLILSFLLVTLVAIACVVLIARRSTAREVQAFMYRGSMVGVDSLANELVAYYQAYGGWQGVDNLLSGVRMGGQNPGMGGMGMMRNQRLVLADANGVVLVDTGQTQTGETLSQAERGAAQPLRVNGQTVGYLNVESGMFIPGTAGTFLLTRLNRAAIGAAIIAGVIALVLALLLSDRLLQPVRQLTGAARKMAGGDLAQRVVVRGDDELAELGLAFNQMADSLQQAERNRQAMTADIAHELRNPLAVQRAHLEALQDGIYPTTPENLQPILDQNLLLARLVEDLRTLAQAEAGQLRLERVPTDLVDLARRMVERFNPEAAGRRLDLSLDVTPELTSMTLMANVDPIRIEQILGNLLSNAARHTPAGGAITVQMRQVEGAALINVRDSGPGIPAEALAHIFERFYRADRARSRAEGGSGLGLAIARQLAEAHGGRLTAANAPEGGAVFTLKIPV